MAGMSVMQEQFPTGHRWPVFCLFMHNKPGQELSTGMCCTAKTQEQFSIFDTGDGRMAGISKALSHKFVAARHASIHFPNIFKTLGTLSHRNHLTSYISPMMLCVVTRLSPASSLPGLFL
jgi:hypothetical protein